MKFVSRLQKVVFGCAVIVTMSARGMDIVLYCLNQIDNTVCHGEQDQVQGESTLWKIVKSGACIGSFAYLIKNSGLHANLKQPMLIAFCAATTYTIFKQDEVELNPPMVLAPPPNFPQITQQAAP